MTRDPYADLHEFAELVPFDSIFGAIARPVIPMRPDDELIPGRDDLEDGHDAD